MIGTPWCLIFSCRHCGQRQSSHQSLPTGDAHPRVTHAPLPLSVSPRLLLLYSHVKACVKTCGPCCLRSTVRTESRPGAHLRPGLGQAPSPFLQHCLRSWVFPKENAIPLLSSAPFPFSVLLGRAKADLVYPPSLPPHHRRPHLASPAMYRVPLSPSECPGMPMQACDRKGEREGSKRTWSVGWWRAGLVRVLLGPPGCLHTYGPPCTGPVLTLP